MARRAFGDCIGCGVPIPPPYLQVEVHYLRQDPGDGCRITNWEEVDVCGACAEKLTLADLHRLLEEPEQAEAANG